jgi:DNA-binding response OmpR family regulator
MLPQIVASQESFLPALPAGKDVMTNLLIVTAASKTALPLQALLTRNGFACMTATFDDVFKTPFRQPPNLVIVEISGQSDTPAWKLIPQLKKQKNLPLIALVSEKSLAVLDGHAEIDDFITSPGEDAELVLRVNRLLHKTKSIDNPDQIRCDGLTIDLVTCEVTIDGNKVELTFKEYELLKLMAASKGRVYTRQALLDKIWGYDYFGGDRTVDVHVRRLRSKIEDATHTYIETVRNIGYRFIKNTPTN